MEAESSGGDEVRQRFTGHERDERVGLDYMLARYYEASLGRFLSTDPVAKPGRNLQSPQRWNRYAYTLNNPLKYFDPNGLDVRVAASAYQAVLYGYQHSAEFRNQFDAAKGNPAVNRQSQSQAMVASEDAARDRPG